VESGVAWGVLSLAQDAKDNVYSVVSWSAKEKTMLPATEGWRDIDSSRVLRGATGQALWYRATRELHEQARSNASRGQSTPIEFMEEQVEGSWLTFKRAVLVVTFCEKGDATEWASWVRDGDSFFPVDIEIFDPEADLLAPLDVAWPRQDIADKLVTVVGLGSIGGAACEALVAYGLRNFALVDHDRLEAHNFARHRATRYFHGAYKVDAVKEILEGRGIKNLKVEPVIAHVGDDANQIRPLIQESSIVVCFADGPESRRIVGHLAYWARKPVVLACVLGFGAYGEVLRLQPGKTGCLECNRASLEDSLNLELELESVQFREQLQRPSESGHVGMSRGLGHYEVGLPSMRTTAVPGDLHLIGGFAAKATVATLLERAGYREQRLPGDHALIGLRPPIEADPPPFDEVTRVGSITWMKTAEPRPTCTTCGPQKTI